MVNGEFKSQFTEEIYKEVIAFANTDGGVVYVGIDNDGNAVGLTDVDKEYTRITNGIRDAIMPDVTMFVRFTVQDNKVVRITVSEGTNKPYYLKRKGLKSSGVYVRQGASSVPANSIKNIGSDKILINFISSHLDISSVDKQMLLETPGYEERLTVLLGFLDEEFQRTRMVGKPNEKTQLR